MSRYSPTLVVGAGPVGLTTALALRGRGMQVTVVEAECEDRLRPGSRAIYVHRESLERLDRIRAGLGHELAAAGLVWPTRRTLWRGRQVYARTYPPPAASDALPPFTSLPQVETEQHLLAACLAAGVRFVWGARVRGVVSTPEGVTVTADGDGSWTADYVVGADGARSAVRHAIGATLEGDTSANSFVVVDVAEDPDDPLPVSRDFHYEHPAVGYRNVLLVPFRGGWRIDLACRVDDDPAEFSGEVGVRRWLPKVIPARYADRIRWTSTYRFLQVNAHSYIDAHRRVLLAGEAAHLFAPFGARGMNSGVVDADAAATAVHAATTSHDPLVAMSAVEHYAATRREAAEFNRAAAEHALAHMQGAGISRVKRRLAAAFAPRSVRLARWLDSSPYGPTASARPGSRY